MDYLNLERFLKVNFAGDLAWFRYERTDRRELRQQNFAGNFDCRYFQKPLLIKNKNLNITLDFNPYRTMIRTHDICLNKSILDLSGYFF